jgi:hypothetical protein
MEVPGWGGQPSYELPQPWHCKPFVDAATYGLEILFSWKSECRVFIQDGRPAWSGDLSQEQCLGENETWSPFSAFAPDYFGVVSMLDIQVPDGMALHISPHPRYFTDITGTVPCAVPGLIQTDWWPRIFFLVFRAPKEGQEIIFRHADPIASILIVPKDVTYELQEMTNEEERSRCEREAKLSTDWMQYSQRVVVCKDGYPFFNNKYKCLSRIAKVGGPEKVNAAIDDPTMLPYYGNEITVLDYRDPPPNAEIPLLQESLNRTPKEVVDFIRSLQREIAALRNDRGMQEKQG